MVFSNGWPKLCGTHAYRSQQLTGSHAPLKMSPASCWICRNEFSWEIVGNWCWKLGNWCQVYFSKQGRNRKLFGAKTAATALRGVVSPQLRPFLTKATAQGQYLWSKQGRKESNPRIRFWRPVFCHWTIPPESQFTRKLSNFIKSPEIF